MRKYRYIIISLVVILMASFALSTDAQELDLTDIDLPSIPMFEKSIKDMTISELQEKIAEILSVIQQLQTILVQFVLQDGSGQAISAIPSSYIFNTNLSYGTSSIEVKYVQIFLNQDPATKVSSTGYGSPGQETTYYGAKTKQAIIKFQLKHRNDISSITGYTIAGTGYLGPGTRQKMNQVLQQYRGGEQPSFAPDGAPAGEAGTYCGDGIAQRPSDQLIIEDCDGADLRNKTCISQGFTGGTLSCNNDCSFNTSQCTGTGGTTPPSGGAIPPTFTPTGPVCGDNTDNICPSGCTYAQDTDCTYCGDSIIQSPNDEGISEVCDSNKLDNQTCITKGYPGGTLQCSSNCLIFDTSSCTLPSPPNEAPVLNPIGNKTVNENSTLTFTISATDADNDTISYSIQNTPSGASFNTLTRTLTWTPTYAQSGTYTLTFTVSDSNLTDTETITITVQEVCNTFICEDLNYECGTYDDNCGGTLDCGTCSSGYTCTSGQCIEDAPAQTTFQISQFGITWTFDKEYQYGQFANGDYWVVPNTPGGNVTIVGIEPPSLNESGRIKHGSMINPDPNDGSVGYDNKASYAHGMYDHSLNVAFEVNDTNPLIITPNSSLISTISYDLPDQWPQLKTAAILTILDNPAPEGSFRPAYSGNDKTIRFNESDLDYSILSELPPVASAPSLATLERKVERPWLDHSPSYLFGRFQPKDNMDSYGRDIADEVGQVSLGLHLDWGGDNNALKRNLYVGFVQVGIDLYGAVKNGMTWVSNGAIFSGRKWPILFAGLALNENSNNSWASEMANIGYVSDADFQEDLDTVYVNEALIYSEPYPVQTHWPHTNYTSGTVTITAGDPYTVIGVGTVWDPEGTRKVLPNYFFCVLNDSRTNDPEGHCYQIGTVDYENQTLTLKIPFSNNEPKAYEDAPKTEVAYKISGFLIVGHGNPGKLTPKPWGSGLDADYRELTLADLGLPIWYLRGFVSPVDIGAAAAITKIYEPTNAGAWQGFVLAALITGAREAWNHEALFDYEDRFMEEALEIWGEGHYGRGWSDFNEDMWDTYRADYGCVYAGLDSVTHERIYQCAGTPKCLATDTSCGIWPNCQNCNTQDGCIGTTYRDYYCSGTSCAYIEYLNDSRCIECTSGQTQSCDTGLLGVCSTGTQTCQTDNTWGSCVQDNQPTTEVCNDSLDNDCDGQTDCDDTDCFLDPACQVTIPTDYISYWKFEGNANDETGANSGTIIGNPQYVTGVQGQALDFDGTGDYVNIADNDVFSFTDGGGNDEPFSISVWINRDSATDWTGTIVAKLIGGAAEYQLSFKGTPTTALFFMLRHPTAFTPWIGRYASHTSATWSHIVVTYDGSEASSGMNIYIDGSLTNTGHNNWGTYTGMTNTDTPVSIGARGDGTDPFNGQIDEVMIYNRALSASEIQDIYDAQKPVGHGAKIEPSENEFFLKNLASILSFIQSAVQEIMKKIQSLF